VKARHGISAAGAALAVVAAIGAIAAAAGSGAVAKTQSVAVADNSYTPTKVSVPKGGTVKWTWSSANRNPHSVTITKAPKGVKKGPFRSQTRVSGYTFKPKFKTPGTYKFHCIVHPTSMRMTVTVKGG
jgi:plastocyanin